jgi:two-component system, OmpR family, heavy metal sensor histidine kinase CusS
MRFERLRTVFRSLRFRLSAWNTAAVLLIVVVTLVGVREALRFTMMSENDHQLLDDTFEVVLAVERFYPDLTEIYNEMDRKALGHFDRRLFVQLLGPRGDVMWFSGEPPALSEFAAPTPNQPSLVTVDGYRVASRPIAREGLPAYTVRVGVSLSQLNHDVAKVSQLMTVAGFVILFVAPALGFFLAGRATHPLARIIKTASRLRPSHIEERLPIRGTRDELDQLSTTINRFLDLLGDYLERNRKFVANAAHELRSPLAAVQSSVEVTLNSQRSIEEYQDMLCEIADECGQLRALVNQLLLLAETDAERFPVDKLPVSFEGLLERSIDMFRGAAEERGIDLVCEVMDEVAIDGDPDRLRQVVNNLIDNSLKYTPPGGRVLVSLLHDREHDQAVLRVVDTGMGISPQDLPHIFERFYRGDKSRQREKFTSGNGLGLSICQSIVSAQGGTVEVESAPGQGATFVVRLPASTSVAVERAESPHSVG